MSQIIDNSKFTSYITGNMTQTYLNLAGNKLLISFDYNPHIVAQLKKIPGCRFNKQYSRWESPIHAYSKILGCLDNVTISKGVINYFAEEAELRRKVEELRKKSYVELEGYTPKAALMAHQKKAFELHRMLKGSADFSEMGAGKCLRNKDLQLVNGELLSAEEVWARYAGVTIYDGTGWWAEPKAPIYINSMDKLGKIIRKPVKNLYKQQICVKLKEVTLDDGSSIAITAAHKLYKSSRWDNNLNTGDIVCIPRYLVHEDGELNSNIANLFGWMVGDGCDSDPDSNKHRFTQKDDTDRKRVENLMRCVAELYWIDLNIIEIQPTESHRSTDLVVQNLAFRGLCEQLGYRWGRKAAGKEVPSSVMRANKDAVAAFLQGYFDAEAYVYLKAYSIEISSASHLLLKQVACLLRRFGIWMRLRKKRARATNGKNIWRDYWVGMIGGPSSRVFYDKIGFSIKNKMEDLKKFFAVKPNSNVEGIPAHKILREIIDKTRLPIRHITDAYTIYLKGTQEPSREVLSKFIDNIDKILDGRKYKELSNLPHSDTLKILLDTYRATNSYEKVAKTLNSQGRRTVNGYEWHGATIKKIIQNGEKFPYKDIYDNLDKNWLKEKRDQLQKLIDQEVHYVEIKNIEEIDYDGWVYDLEVEDTHNYVAENILCHNTGSAICIAHWHIEMGHTKKVLVICPKSVLKGWEEQIEFFSDLTYTSISGNTKEERLAKLNLKRDMYLINYEYTWRIPEELLTQGFNLVIVDEAHRIKNPDSNQSKACYSLGDAAEYRIALTGTPVLNSPLDAFGVMRFVDPTIFGESIYPFRAKYFTNVGNENSPIQIYVPKHGAQQEISDKMYTRSLRFLKEECLDLPKAIHMPDRIVTLSAEQDRAYRKLQEELAAEITETKSIKINHVLTLMLKLNQITSGWVKDPDTGEIIHFKQNPKLEELKEVVEDVGEQPIIIWSYYREDMRVLTEYYGRCNKCKSPVNNIKEENCPNCGTFIKYRCSEIQGGTKNRNGEIAKFRFTPEERAKQRLKYIEEGKTPQEIRYELCDLLPDGSEPPQTNIFCAQCVAASEGLNLQISTVSIYYSRNWSLKDWTQSLARNHRQGQTKPVTYICLVARLMDGDPTVDQRIADALKRKEDLSKKINKDDIKLLTGDFGKKNREALKDVLLDDSDPTEAADPEKIIETNINVTDSNSIPDQKTLF